MSERDPVLDATRTGQFTKLPRRIWLTYRYHGPGVVIRRLLTFPLRFTSRGLPLRLGRVTVERRADARAWYAGNARPVTVVIPSFGAAAEVAKAVASIRRTTRAERVRIVVCDDAGPPEELERIRVIRGIEVRAGERNLGFAGNANRGLQHADPEMDVVLLNADVEVRKGWLESLQWAAYAHSDDVGIVGARLLYPNGQIQHAGVRRNDEQPEWFDHRFRFAPADHGPADVPLPVLAVTGACMYVRREVIARIGLLDPAYGMGYEDVDWCLRAWEAGYQVRYEPGAVISHAESSTRPRDPGERELAAQRHFWDKWAAFFGPRDVRTPDGHLRIAYVTHGTGIGGGHRLVFEYLNRLADRGHEVSLHTLEAPPEWFDLRVPVHTYPGYDELAQGLAPLQAIKVASWWKTAEHVWRASVVNGVPVYYVQDLETSYYPDGESRRHEVLASYREEFRYLTISGWIRDQLRALSREAELLTPAIDHGTFRPLGRRRRAAMVLAIARGNPLKRLHLTIGAWRALSEPRPELCLFGVEPELAPPGTRFVDAPSDEQVNELLNECTVFVQTSSHEGFALPPLEAMATGAAVVCTDAHGNRDFCEDEVNCLMPAGNASAVREAIERLLADPGLRGRLGAAGIETARGYDFDSRVRQLERFYEEVATGSLPPAALRG